MIIEISRESSYIPEFGGNRNLPADEQVVVHYRKPTLELKRRLMRLDMKVVTDKSGEMKFESATMPSREDVLEGMTVRFDNLSYREDGRERSIVTAKDLLSAPVVFDELVSELYNHYISELNARVDEKK